MHHTLSLSTGQSLNILYSSSCSSVIRCSFFSPKWTSHHAQNYMWKGSESDDGYDSCWEKSRKQCRKGRKEPCSTPHFVGSGKREFWFPKTLALLSWVCRQALIWETYFHASHFQFTYLFVSSKRCPSSLQLQGFKTTPINTCAHTHSLSHSALLTISHAYQLVRPNCGSGEAPSCPG